MKAAIKIALFAAAFAIIAAILAGLYLFFEKHKNMAKTKPDLRISAILLQKEFEENEATASSKYINKVIEVTGTIVSFTQAENNNLNISLLTGNAMSSVICTLPASEGFPELKIGKAVTIRGECSGYLLDVLLNNCVIIAE